MINVITPEHGSLSVEVSGSTATITATPDSGYVLASVLAVSDGQQLEIVDMQFSVPETDVDVSATFIEEEQPTPEAEQKQLTALYTNGEVSFSIDGSTVVAAYPGQTVLVAIDPFVGYQCSAVSGVDIPTTGGSFVMPDDNVTIEVTFTQIDYTVTCGEGVQADVPTAHAGDTVTAVPISVEEGMTFLGFIVLTDLGAVAQTLDTIIEFTMPPFNVLVRQMTEEEAKEYAAQTEAAEGESEGDKQAPDTSDVDDDTDRDTGTLPTDTPEDTPVAPDPEQEAEVGNPGETPPEVTPVTPEIVPAPKTKIITVYDDQIIDDFSPATLQAFEAAGAIAIAVYEDGTEAQVPWSSVTDPKKTVVASDASAIAAANNQHFWNRTTAPSPDDGAGTGAFVTDEEKDTFLQAMAQDVQPTTSRPLHNLIMNSQGILLRAAKKIRAAFTPSGVAFYDGAGNESSNIVARFGSEGAQIGKDSGSYIKLTNDEADFYRLSQYDYQQIVVRIGNGVTDYESAGMDARAITSMGIGSDVVAGDVFILDKNATSSSNERPAISTSTENPGAIIFGTGFFLPGDDVWNTNFNNPRNLFINPLTGVSSLGDITGNLTGDVIGNVVGDVTGDVIGTLTGDVIGTFNGVDGRTEIVTIDMPAKTITLSFNHGLLVNTSNDPLTVASNSVYAASLVGGNPPEFRLLVPDDIPDLSNRYLPLTGGTLSGPLTVTGNVAATNDINASRNLNFGSGAAATQYVIAARTPSRNARILFVGGGKKTDGDANGTVVGLGAGGLTLVGGGEYANNRYNVGDLDDGSENLYLGADQAVRIESNGQTIANRKTWLFGTGGTLELPQLGYILVKNPNIDGTASTLDAVQTQHLTAMIDANNNTVTTLLARQYKDGANATLIQTARTVGTTTKYNVLSVGLHADGSCYYDMTDRDAFREVIGALSKSNPATTSNFNIRYEGLDSSLANNGLSENVSHAYGFVDKNTKYIGFVECWAGTNGDIYTGLQSRKIVNGSNVNNTLRLRIKNDGTKTVEVSDPAAWRTAIGALAPGGTLTGKVDTSNQYPFTFNSEIVDTTQADNGLEYNNSRYIRFLDTKGNYYAWFTASARTSGAVSNSMSARNIVNGSNVDNILTLWVAKDGTRSVAVSDAAPWRTALGLGSLATRSSFVDTAWTNLSLNSAVVAYDSAATPKYAKVAGIVTLVGAVKPSAQIAASTTFTIGVLPEGHRPKVQTNILCQGSGSNVWLLTIETNGNVKGSRYRNGTTAAAIPTTDWLPFHITFAV